MRKISEKSRKVWYYVLYAIGLTVCIVPPLLATLEHFPVWVKEEGQKVVVPATAVVLLILSAYPLFRFLRKKLKTPSVWMVWVLLWIVLRALRPVIDGMISVAGIGAICNVAGATLMFISRKFFGGFRRESETSGA